MDYDVIEALLAKLAIDCPSAETVDEAWFAAPLDNLDQECPAILAYLAEERPAGSVETLRPVQRVTLVYGIWLVCSRADFRIVRQQVSDSLFGHQFGERYDPTVYMGGKVDDIRGDLIWWREYWSIDTWRRAKTQTQEAP